jgi:hypothetical protein
MMITSATGRPLMPTISTLNIKFTDRNGRADPQLPFLHGPLHPFNGPVLACFDHTHP